MHDIFELLQWCEKFLGKGKPVVEEFYGCVTII